MRGFAREAVALALTVAGCLMSGCGPAYSPPSFGTPDTHYSGGARTLAVVSPPAWDADLAPYVAAKRAEGFRVTLVAPDDTLYDLVAHLATLAPDYVFLVGDQSFIPTYYDCEPISWSPSYGRGCTYSDAPLAPGAVVGRLLTPDEAGVRRYVARAAAYSARLSVPSSAYLVADLAYPGSLGVVSSDRDLLGGGAVAVVGKGDVLVPTATDATLAAAVARGDAVGYYGHGDADGWGYALELPARGMNFPAGASPAPAVLAVGCETARAAPNPPWYAYLSASGVVTRIPPSPFVPAASIPDPATLQPESLLNDSVAARFTSDQDGGAMTYLGETVVTGDDSATETFYAGLLASRTHAATVGDVWRVVRSSLRHPEFWQFTGDPTTWLPLGDP